MNNIGCEKCLVRPCDAEYRGSRCSALRAKAGVDFDPKIYNGNSIWGNCAICGEEIKVRWHYCPNCGASLDFVEEETDIKHFGDMTPKELLTFFEFECRMCDTESPNRLCEECINHSILTMLYENADQRQQFGQQPTEEQQ